MKDSSFQGNGRFATNLADEMIQVQAMRLMSENREENLLEKAIYIESEDVDIAFKKMALSHSDG